MNRNLIVTGVALALLLLTGAWWLGWFQHEDPLIVQTREIMETPREEQSKEEQNALRTAWDERMKGMTDEQRMGMFEAMLPIMVPLWMRQFENQYDKFIVMTPEEQRKKLDERIDRMQRGERGRLAGGPGGGPGGGGGGGNRPQMDPKKGAEIQKKMLAYTTPEQRAKFDNGMQMFTARMKERGLTPPPMQGGGFF